ALRVVHGVLGPADDLAAVVRAGCEAVGPTERWQRRHLAVLPLEAETAEAGARGGGEEDRAAPVLLERVRLVGLRDARDQPAHVLDRPAPGAVPFRAAGRGGSGGA